MAQWPDAVLFDFDGVLVHSEPLHFLALQQIAAEENLPLTEEQYYADFLGFDDRGLFRRLLEQAERPFAPADLLRLVAKKKVVAERLIHEKQYKPLAGVEETVRALWRHYPLAICSGALSTEIELMLEGIRLRDCFRVIVSAEDVSVGKPDPECYLRGVELLAGRYHRRLNPKNCIVFEDAPRVIDRLKPLGFTCVGVATHLPKERFADADYVIESLTREEIKAKIPGLELFDEPGVVE
jgi:HAD superfamily hydrolase (TIGR01509 family)